MKRKFMKLLESLLFLIVIDLILKEVLGMKITIMYFMMEFFLTIICFFISNEK